MGLLPSDEHNAELESQTHPLDWTNPAPPPCYNLVAVGGGTAGIIAALGAAGLGGRAAIVERHLLGGDCLNYGCVPSKALIRAARAAYQIRTAGAFGIHTADASVEFAEVMERMRRLRAGISRHDSAARFRSLGVDVYFGDARFVGKDAVCVGDQTLRFHRAVIATGGRAATPDTPGLAELGYLTNETVFSLTSLPRRLIVLGGGPVGCELAQAFRRFGSDVHLVQRHETLLAKEEPAAAEIVRRQFEREGIALHLGWTPTQADRTGAAKGLIIERQGARLKLMADEILVAAGRRPNVENLGLEAAGVLYDEHGVQVDDFLRTSNPAIYAAGDVCTRRQFTHHADAQARIVVQNALFLGRKRASRLVVPRCTYTDPEVAQVGLTPVAAKQQGILIDSYRAELGEVDRAILDGETDGFAVVHVRRGTDRIIGATIVAAHAGEMIGEMTLAMTNGLGLKAIAATIHCYPTQVEVLKRIADSYNRTRLTPRVAGLMRKWLSWRRGGK